MRKRFPTSILASRLHQDGHRAGITEGRSDVSTVGNPASLDEKAVASQASPTRRKRDPLTKVLIVMVCVGLALFLYPAVSNWWNGRHMDDAAATYDQTVSHSSEDDLKAMRKAAVAYNKTLLTQGDRYHLSDAQMSEYTNLLNPSGNGVMGQVIIPKLGLELPIYHGTSNEVLAEGIGHIPGSSLPVGGASTHCVISGHRGLPTSELFTNIDQLVEGDTFELHVLGKTLTYQVDQIRIVLPDQVQDLAIEPGQDLCTLVTCTPYQINTHRLLVRGHRIATVETADVPADATQIDDQVEMVVLFVAGVAIAWGVYLLRERRRRRAAADLADVRTSLGL